ncbi:hypothetical protein [Alteromonas facilis]|uniref:hypothetical protein n=1 Tax=Alteromonas facilis TaxID=2048004 RepID=UPI000C28A62A|nr:hypothetical protein [Alteromonas facilis]
MDELTLTLLVLLATALVILLLGAFFRTSKSHDFINGREHITDITEYANGVGNSLMVTAASLMVIGIAFYTQTIGEIGLALGVVCCGFLPIPWIARTHIKYTKKKS